MRAPAERRHSRLAYRRCRASSPASSCPFLLASSSAKRRDAARDLDLQVVVVREGLTGREPQRSFLADEVFPRVCRVRSTDEVLAALDRFAPTTGAPE